MTGAKANFSMWVKFLWFLFFYNNIAKGGDFIPLSHWSSTQDSEQECIGAKVISLLLCYFKKDLL